MGGFSWVLEKARVKVNLEGYNGSLLRSSWVRLPNDGGRGRDARDCSTGFCLKGLVCVANWSLFGGCQAFSTCVVCLRMSFFLVWYLRCSSPLSSSRHLSSRISPPSPPDNEVCEDSFLSHPCGFSSFPSTCSFFHFN